MTSCFTFDVPDPEFYRAAHAEFGKHPTDEMLLHLARPTDQGVQVVEVWTSAEAFDSWMAEIAGEVVGALTAAGWTVPQVVPTPFDPAGLIMTGAKLVI